MSLDRPGNGEWAEAHEDPSAEEASDIATSSFERLHIPPPPRKSAVNPDTAFIDRVVDHENGERMVEKHHRDLFRALHAPAIGKLHELRKTIDASVRHHAAQVTQLTSTLRNINRFLIAQSHDGPSTPWTWSDRFSWALLSFVSVMALVLGVNALATYLIGSGYIVFAEKPGLAYLLASLNVLIAAGLKFGGRLQRTDRGKRLYRISLWIAAMLSGATWIATFSALFPDIQNQSVEEIVRGLTRAPDRTGQSLDNIFVAAQVVCEICVAGVLFLWMGDLSASHRPAATVSENEEYAKYEALLRHEERKLARACQQRGEIKGTLEAFEALEKALVSEARSIWISRAAQLDRKPFSSEDND